MKRFQLIVKLIFLFVIIHNIEVKAITGIPYVTSYNKSDYPGSATTWSIEQDNRGVMYFASNSGVLEFNGSEWKIIPMPNRSIVRKVYKNSEGIIYVSAYNQFGYLTADKKGNTIYVSLSDTLKSKKSDIGIVWNIVEMPWGMLFITSSSVIVLNKDLKRQVTDKSFSFSFKVDDKLYMADSNEGLLELTKDGLVSVGGGEMFKQKTVTSILKVDDKNLLIATAFSGIFKYDGEKVTEWKTKVNTASKNLQIYCSLKLDNNLYAFGTIKNGIYISDDNGEIVNNINLENGLQNNSVHNLFVDNRGNLWAALDNGIDYISINSPVSQLFPNGVIGSGYVSHLKEKVLYLGTNQSLYSINWPLTVNQPLHSSIEKIKNVDGQIWSIKEFDGHLLCGAHSGIYEIADNSATLITDISGGWTFLETPIQSNYIIGGTYDGLILLRKSENFPHYRFIKKLSGFDYSCKEIEFDKEGDLWVSHGQKGVYRVVFNSEYNSIKRIDYYGARHGLPSDYDNSIAKFENKLFVSTIDGVYHLDNETGKFKLCDELKSVLGRKKIDKFYEASNKDIWFFTSNRLGILRKNYQGKYSSEILQFKELKGNFIHNMEHILPLDNNNFVISTEDGFSFFDNSRVKGIKFNLQLVLTGVESINGKSLFGGMFVNSKGAPIGNQTNQQMFDFEHKYNNLKFYFSTNVFSNQDRVEYRYFLEGLDEGWTNWTDRNYIEYAKLKHCKYILHAIVRNQAQVESEEQQVHFVIQKPIYLRVQFLVIYFIVLLLFIYGIIYLIKYRISTVKEQLKQKQRKQLQQQQNTYENERLRIEQEVINLRNEKLNLENERNQVEIENKTKELASIIMKITYTNEIINTTRNSLLKVVNNMVHRESKDQIERLVTNLGQELNKEEDWQQFQMYFDQINDNFIHRLRTDYPDLTHKDLKTAAYVRMNLSTKEIAQLLNLTIRGVETSRYRLRKRLNLTQSDNLVEFLVDF